jgi:hypothetical protein
MIGYKDDRPANGQILLICKFYGIAQCVIRGCDEKVHHINHPFMRPVAKNVKAYPLQRMKNT